MQVPGPAPAAADRRQSPRPVRCSRRAHRTRCPAAARSFQVHRSLIQEVCSRRRTCAKSCRASIRHCRDRCRAAHAFRIRDSRVHSTQHQPRCPRVRGPVLSLLVSPCPSSRKARTRWLHPQLADDAAWVLRCDIEQGVRRSSCGSQPRVARRAILNRPCSIPERCDLQRRARACTRREPIRSSWFALRGTSVWAGIGEMGPIGSHHRSRALQCVDYCLHRHRILSA
jgi:hypothetical protein